MHINDAQLELVDKQIKRILKSGNYYAEVYKKAGITGVNSEEDFLKIPFTDKADLRNAYPLGIQAVPDEQVVRIVRTFNDAFSSVSGRREVRQLLRSILWVRYQIKDQEVFEKAYNYVEMYY